MNVCAQCKYFHPREQVTPLGQCYRWHGGNGSGGYDRDVQVADNEVIVETDEGWGAFMGPAFGCVLWEAK